MYPDLKRSLARYTGNLWTSGDFSIGRAAPPKTDKGEHPLGGVFRDESGYHRDIARTTAEWHPDAAKETAYRVMDWADACGAEPLRSRDLARAALEMAEHADNGTVPQCDRRNYLKESGAPGSLGLSAVINSRSPRNKPGRKSGKPSARRGSKGITTYGKKMVRSAVTLLSRRCDRRCLSFGTATIPTLSADEHRVIALRWPKIQNRFMEKVSRTLVRHGLPSDYIVVTEIQPKRWERWGVVGLHFHWLVQARHTPFSGWAITPRDIERMWSETLANEVGHPVDAKASTRVEVPRKNPRAELSKYMSKGAEVIRSVAKAGRGDELPTAWWGASRSLKQEVKSKIERFSSADAEWILDNVDQLRSMKLITFRHIYVDLGTDESTGVVDRRWMGISGYFLSDMARKKVMSWTRQKTDISRLISTGADECSTA